LFRFSIRELLWLMLVIGVASGWWVESARARVWRQRAEIAAGQLEAEHYGKMVFAEMGVHFDSPYKDPQLQHTFIPTGGD